jgi:hypothetical protein
MALSGCVWVGNGVEKVQWRKCPGVRGSSVATPSATGREGGGSSGVRSDLGLGRPLNGRVRKAVGMLRRCPDDVFEVALAGKRRRGRKGHGGTTRFARCGRPGR